ncbi:Transcriptional regulatory protein, C terminal [Serratia proteamaculans]|uniref:winged helix-turn-helix domain-containing protein n=1 Tax=Serratia proteamaculans TaxID=28151 RepID=UPI00217C0696|nr:helix-turn-helix domain-containing protein [Serratia proteamaculans]CAI1920898.1 Transcriptional regulatory protein, C terminal [Serratia proteamaculans]
MKFLINEKILFNEDKSTIEALEDSIKPVMLTGTLCRLLSLLVRNHNNLLARDFILSNVWDEYGKTSSHSNLNNYISVIRKLFKEFGEIDIIVTVPKQGFIFSAFTISIVDGRADIINNDNAPLRPHDCECKFRTLFFASCLMNFILIIIFLVVIYVGMKESKGFIGLT